MNGIEQLLSVARAYAAARRVDLSVVSWRVFGDSKKFGAIERGAGITIKRLERALQWLSDNWPDDEPWPSGAPRPTPRPSPSAAEHAEAGA